MTFYYYTYLIDSYFETHTLRAAFPGVLTQLWPQ